VRQRVATRRVVRSVVAALIVAVGIVVAAGYVPGATTPAFAAPADHHAVVVVDTGSLVRTVCVHFTADSISGQQALDLAGVSPVYRGYGTTGAAICSLCQQGCPADGSCLTCGGADYWQYYQSPAGSTSYHYSPVGAGVSQVHDGDVEGWKWGHSIQPPHVSFESVCGVALQVVPTTLQPQVTTTAPAAQTTSAASGGSGGGSGGSGAGGPTATTAAKSGAGGGRSTAGAPTTLPGAGSSTAAGSMTTAATVDGTGAAGAKATSTTAGGATKRALGDPVAPKLPGSKGGGSPLPLILVGLLVLALVGAGVFLRLRRGRPASS
jgi:hypothetical protein